MCATVCKFGGSSVSDAGMFVRVRRIINNSPDRKYIVLSAPGKRCADDRKVTDLFLAAYQGSLQGDYSTLATKAVLDLIIIMVMTCSMGRGCVFSAIPVAVFQGSITLLAGLIKPLMTAPALDNLSLVGNVLIFCVGINLVWGKKIKVANLLPAIAAAVAAVFLPI